MACPSFFSTFYTQIFGTIHASVLKFHKIPLEKIGDLYFFLVWVPKYQFMGCSIQNVKKKRNTCCNLLTLYVLVTHKCVLWQPGKTQIKCHIMWHFISLHCLLRQNQISEIAIKFYLEIITSDPSIYAMDHPKFIISNQKEDSISA